MRKQILEKLEIFSVKCVFFTRSRHTGKITKLKNKQNTGKKVQITVMFSHCLSFHFFLIIIVGAWNNSLCDISVA